MNNQSGQSLQDLLRKRVAAVRDDVLHSGVEITETQLESLTRLAKVVELESAVRPTGLLGRWLAASLFFVSLAIASVLLFSHVRETDVVMQVRMSEVSFSFAAQQVIAETIALHSLGLSGLSQVALPSSSCDQPKLLRGVAGQDLAIRLSAGIQANPGASITVAPFSVPRDTRVTVRLMSTSGNYRISLKGKVFEVPISVVGRTSIERSDDAARIIDCAVPQSISAEASDGGVLMDVIASEPPNIRFSSQLLVRDLAFARIEQFLSSDQPLVRRVSTIIGGSILFTELNDKGYKLRAGEVIGLDGLSGELRTLELYKDHMTASFTGHLKGLTTGSSQSLRTLMPTWLEWLEARHGLSLLWGSAAYIFGLACAVARWWNS